MGTSFNLADSVIRHLELTLASLLISMTIGIVLGLLLYKSKMAGKIISIFSVIQTIPTLAMLGFLVPILGIGKVPALFVLIVYGSYPVFINTYSGLTQVDPEYIEISEALGMNPPQQMFKVRLPLSIPVIMAGIRTSLVSIIGLATLTSLIGSGGLGDFIYRGINAMNNKLILYGTIPVTLIVLMMSYFLKKVEDNWKFIYRHSRKIIFAACIACLLYAIVPTFVSGKDKTMTLSSKDFTESGILTTIMAELIENKTDINVEKKMYMGTTDILHKALLKGEIDGYVEYTGTSYLTVFNQSEPRDDMLQYVTEEYQKIGITALEPLGINNTFVVLQTQTAEDKYGIHTLTDLADYPNQFVLSSYAEFAEREDGLKSLISTYGLQFKDVKQLERSLGYKALNEGKVDFMVSFSTEPAIYKYGFREVKDDKELFMRYDAIPVFSTKTLEEYPELKPVLNALAGKLDNDTMAKLNNEVENNERKEVDVAREWLLSQGLIDK